MISAGGGSEKNSLALTRRVRAGGRASLIPMPTRTALGISYVLDDFDIILSGLSVNAGALLCIGLSMTGDSDLYEASINTTPPIVFTVDSQAFSTYNYSLILSGIMPATQTGRTISVALVDRATSGVMTVSMFEGIGGALQTQKSLVLPSTANPDTGLATLQPSIPQIHYGIIANNGNYTDTKGTWQASMIEGQYVETGYAGSIIKEGYRLLITAAQARAYIVGQTSRPTNALVACYA